MTPASRKPRRLVLAYVAGFLIVLSGWVALDLFGQRTQSLRDFDPREVARLDTAMWRSYYGKQRLLLFFQLTELLRKEYHLPWLRSQWVSYQAAKAAFVFKEGRTRNDYEKALPYLRAFYSAISAIATTHLTLIVPPNLNWSGGLCTVRGSNIHRRIFRDSWPRLQPRFTVCRMIRFLSTGNFEPRPCKFGIVRLRRVEYGTGLERDREPT